jgi:trk system potassium uptake protein
MYVVIIGAGEVGSHIARVLVEEGHDVAVVELDELLAERLDANLNALVVRGSGVSPTVLKRAGVERADLLLAVTSTDEVNLIACMTARKYGGPRLRVVARVRQSHDVAGDLSLSAEDLGLDALISPEEAITTAVLEDLRFAGSGEMRELAEGRLVLVGMDLAPDSPLVHESIDELRHDFPGDFLVVGIQGRNSRIPTGDDHMEAGDRAYLLTRPQYLTELAILSGEPWYRPSRILIVGCGNTGLALARALEGQKQFPTIIEIDRERAELLAGMLPRCLVLHGDGTDPDFLRSQIEKGRIDAVVVLLKDPEKSVLIGIFASSLGARKAIVRCDKSAYAPLAHSQGVDAVISPKGAMTDAIQRYVRSGNIEVSLLLGERHLEFIQFRVPDQPARLPVGKRPIRELGLPTGSTIGALMRDGDVFIAPDAMTLQPGDELLVVSPRDILDRVESMLS